MAWNCRFPRQINDHHHYEDSQGLGINERFAVHCRLKSAFFSGRGENLCQRILAEFGLQIRRRHPCFALILAVHRIREVA
jgi:hypothetical protein